jgi:hypothetical protein
VTTKKERPRKTAKPPEGKTVKASLIMDVETHRKWIVAASLSGRKREDIALDAIKDACSWVVISDRRKDDAPPVANDDRPRQEESLIAQAEIAA